MVEGRPKVIIIYRTITGAMKTPRLHSLIQFPLLKGYWVVLCLFLEDDEMWPSFILHPSPHPFQLLRRLANDSTQWKD